MTEYRCSKEGEISELRANVRAIFQRIDEMRSIYDNLTKLTDSVHNLTVNMSVFAEQMKDTKEDMAKIRDDMEYLRSVPLDEYSSLKKAMVGAIVGLIVGYMGSVLLQGVI